MDRKRKGGIRSYAENVRDYSDPAGIVPILPRFFGSGSALNPKNLEL